MPQSPSISVSTLWRYPVKSMMGERVDAADLVTAGMVGDRAWAARDEVRAFLADNLDGELRCAVRRQTKPTNEKKENKMSIIAKASEKEFENIPLPEAGTVHAVCCGVWDLGMQESTYNGETKLRHKIVIAWELSQLIDARILTARFIRPSSRTFFSEHNTAAAEPSTFTEHISLVSGQAIISLASTSSSGVSLR